MFAGGFEVLDAFLEVVDVVNASLERKILEKPESRTVWHEPGE
jgi:hypothetical protein